MEWTRIQILNHENGNCGIRLVDEQGNTTNIVEFNAKALRALAAAMLVSADKADAVKQFGPNILKDMKKI